MRYSKNKKKIGNKKIIKINKKMCKKKNLNINGLSGEFHNNLFNSEGQNEPQVSRNYSKC
ncbi:MAG: hypothetical protein BAJALOKI1v1_310024 [Promethearchaeota archaeon]|nr:MAG: hypothetical protein BAJALOKI1v1_310024 [Candidatus Lokiarchaeota archaeon]